MRQACFLVVGSGSIGRRHLRNLRQLRPDARIVVLRRPESVAAGKPEGCDQVINNWPDALALLPDAAVIASPSPFHAHAARELLQRGTSVLIEKPLAPSYAEAAQLRLVAKNSTAAALVGYNLRFEPGVQAYREMLRQGAVGRVMVARGYVGQYLPDWRPDADYRSSVSGRAELGGGPLLELSHEIDLACWFFGVPDVVHCVGGRYSALEIDVEDAVELTLEFSNPPRLVTLGLNFLERVPTRRFEVVGSEASLRWDGISRQITVCSNGGTRVTDHSAPDRNAAYLAELEHFLACAEGKEEPSITVDDGLNVLAVIEAARRSMLTGAGERPGGTN